MRLLSVGVIACYLKLRGYFITTLTMQAPDTCAFYPSR